MTGPEHAREGARLRRRLDAGVRASVCAAYRLHSRHLIRRRLHELMQVGDDRG